MIKSSRRVYSYVCDWCDKPRETVDQITAEEGICPTCIKASRANENQLNMFQDSGDSDGSN